METTLDDLHAELVTIRDLLAEMKDQNSKGLQNQIANRLERKCDNQIRKNHLLSAMSQMQKELDMYEQME